MDFFENTAIIHLYCNWWNGGHVAQWSHTQSGMLEAVFQSH